MRETKYLSISHPWNNWSKPRPQLVRLRLVPVRVSGHQAGAVGTVTLLGLGGAWESDSQCQEEYHKLGHSVAQFSGMARYDLGAPRDIHTHFFTSFPGGRARVCLTMFASKKEGRKGVAHMFVSPDTATIPFSTTQTHFLSLPKFTTIIIYEGIFSSHSSKNSYLRRYFNWTFTHFRCLWNSFTYIFN